MSFVEKKIKAYHHKLYGRKYTWFFIGWYADTWYIPPPEEHLNCTTEQVVSRISTRSSLFFEWKLRSIPVSANPQIHDDMLFRWPRLHSTISPQKVWCCPETRTPPFLEWRVESSKQGSQRCFHRIQILPILVDSLKLRLHTMLFGEFVPYHCMSIFVKFGLRGSKPGSRMWRRDVCIKTRPGFCLEQN